MANGLKYGSSNLTAIQFDEPIIDIESRYDFRTWIFNASEQPSDGVVIEKNKITISKFKPNVPILTTNLTGSGAGDTPTSSEICLDYKKVALKINGFSANIDKFTNYEETNIRRNWITAKIKGLWFGPIYTYNNKILPIESVCDGTDGQYITYTNGTTVAIQDETTALRGTGGGFAQYFHVSDKEDIVTPDWISIPNIAFIRTETSPYWNWSPAGDSSWQICIALFTGYAVGQDGYISLSSPITIRLENTCPNDPTTIEGYRAAIGETEVYNKQKTFANTLMRHKLASEQNGVYQRPVSGAYYGTISSSGNTVYPIGANFFDSAARFVIKDANGQYSLTVNGFYFLENLKWYPNVTQVAVGDTVTIYGKIIGIKSDATSASTVEHGGRLYAINGTMSTIGNTHTAPGTAGNAGTLATPYTVDNAVLYARTLGDGIADTNNIYITGKIESILSEFAPSYYFDYDRLRIPVPTDLGTLIAASYPIKFWITQYDDPDHDMFWSSVATIFQNTPITDPLFANHLFSMSGGELSTISFTFDVGLDENGDEKYIDMTAMFDGSNLPETVNFNITTGVLKSLVNVFRNTHTLQSVSFNKIVYISDWSGAFEGSYLENFPANIAPLNQFVYKSNGHTFSSPSCDIHYVADGSHLLDFGNYEDSSQTSIDDKCYELIVHPYCIGAFSRSAITEIKYLLDMKLVSPDAGMISDYWSGVSDSQILFNSFLNNSNLETAYIKNLNKGDWSFDGVVRNNVCGGNLSGLNEASVTYLLTNVFDLNLNTSLASRIENELNSFNSWTSSSGTKTGISFSAYGSCTLSKNLSSSGTMQIKITANDCTITFTNGGTTTTITPSATTQSINVVSGDCVFTVTANADAENVHASFELDEDYHFLSELTSGLSSANIYFPAGFGSLIQASALQEANDRGWTVYVGGTIYTI